MKENTLEAIKSWLGFGSQLVGAATGGAAGVLLVGPGGAALGGMGGVAVAEAFNKVGAEVLDRYLGNREKERVGALYYFAISKIKERLDLGDKIRNDEFFQAGKNSRDAASELLEAAILAAQKEHEELKIKFISNLIANMTFDSSFGRAKANYFIKVSTNLSYRQYCILAVYKNKQHYEKIVRPEDKGFMGLTPIRNVGIARIGTEYRLPLDKWVNDLPQEIKEIERLDLIKNENMVTADKLRESILSPLGEILYTNLGLKDLDEQDLVDVAKLFL